MANSANTKVVSSQIEINASPTHVRSVFFDFAAWPTWSKGPGITGISAVVPRSNDMEIEAGEKIKINLSGTTFKPTVLENTPEQFSWRGGITGLFHGDHFFKFLPSKENPGGTTLVNEEVYFGPLVWVIQKVSSTLDNHTGENYMILNKDFKARVESLKES
ncbi:uncharacterized protein RCC_02317 [Ramularia collo-cygni]|uniref:Uncharacterized protein n=1 Tax=Ramularia collo-cygni TaxID=112498 RepID=A0A2D3V1Y1_9PEZI|nr:uncharacterized protein RCC_02317 [Ramularia collo-cygni]CZT16474.1 uncharacterized protein RCC_02317 [Ramularia collo-cygni]